MQAILSTLDRDERPAGGNLEGLQALLAQAGIDAESNSSLPICRSRRASPSTKASASPAAAVSPPSPGSSGAEEFRDRRRGDRRDPTANQLPPTIEPRVDLVGGRH
jgi:hypothetical protein